MSILTTMARKLDSLDVASLRSEFASLRSFIETQAYYEKLRDDETNERLDDFVDLLRLMRLADRAEFLELNERMKDLAREVEVIKKEIAGGTATRFIIEVDGKIWEENEVMDLKVNKKVPFSIKPVDQFGNAAPIDGPARITASNDDLVSIDAAADGLTGFIIPKGPANTQAVVSFTGDGDLTGAEKLFTSTLSLNLLPGDAAGFVVNVGEPVDV